MSMTVAQALDRLNTPGYPACWEKLAPAVEAEFAASGCKYVSEEYLGWVDREFGALIHCRELLTATAKIIRETPELAIYTLLLSHAFADLQGNFYPWTEWQPPVTEDPVVGEMTAVFALLSAAPAIYAEMNGRGVPHSVIAANIQSITFGIKIFEASNDRPGYDNGRMRWSANFVRCSHLTVGRFNFEMGTHYDPIYIFRNKAGEYCALPADTKIHKSGRLLGSAGCTDEEGSYDADFVETDEYWEGYACNGVFITKTRKRLLKSGWELVIKPNDKCIRVHIPRAESFRHDLVAESYARLRKILRECYPEFPEIIICGTWLLDPQIETIVGSESNLVKFRNDYHLFPRLSSGKAPFSFMFLKPFEKYEDLPEDTRLMRGVKKLYLNGEYIHEAAGICLL